MTSLLLHWLNEELALHRKVSILERDLCNGYIFAEILHIHGLESHLERYTDERELQTRVANLELLDKAMVAAGLGELGTTTKRQILMENPSSIRQLLLQMKAFFESKRTKVSMEQQRLRSIPSKVYEPRSPVKDPTRIVQDVEERFIKEKAKQYHPTKVQYYKDVNNVIYLRKFSQAQWQAENEKIEYEDRLKADNSKQAANGMAALRARMKEKRTFSKEWDEQRLEKWQQTQKLYMEAERDDLRLELTLEERRRRFDAAILSEIRTDARNGVVGFEKNISRLGLGNGGVVGEAGLRAIPASDPGAIAHFDRLEERVKELGFRPSNNVQMMKELRARRVAQLAAEKDRRIRRTKAVSESNRIVASPIGEPDCVRTHDQLGQSQIEVKSEELSGAPITSIQDAFIEANRETLEANYARLREIGTVKREQDIEELQRLRLQKWSKIHGIHTQDCAAIVDDLVSLAIACMEVQAERVQDVVEWKRKSWLELCHPTAMTMGEEPTFGDDQTEVEVLTHTFLSLSNTWDVFTGPMHQCTSALSDAISDQLESFIRTALAVPSPDLLETKWTKLEATKYVVVFTSDERSHGFARQVAVDHCLHYFNIEDLIEECIKNSYDPVKQADVAATLGRRERELGVLGPKIAALRQKSSPIPEALAVEIVLAAVTSTQVCEVLAEGEVVEANHPVVENDAVSFLLHNFPRTIEEWKLFEKAVLTIEVPAPTDEVKVERLAALESSLTATPLPFRSCISCAIAVSSWEPFSRTPSPSTPGLTPSSSAGEVGSSAADRRRTAEVSKRQSVVDPAVAKAEAEQEIQLKRRQVEEILSRTSCLVTIDQEEMHERVLQELIHLAIDVYTSETDRECVVVECGAGSPLPLELAAARESRRSTMAIEQRIAWMVAAKQLQLNDQALFDVVMRLRRLENARYCNLLRLFKEASCALAKVSQSAQVAHQTLDSMLGAISSNCQRALERASIELTSHPSLSEKIFISTEVALGDIVDAQRILANQFVDDAAHDLQRLSHSHVLRWLERLPFVCLEVKEFAVDSVCALRDTFYTQFGFLRSASTSALPMEVAPAVLNELLDAVKRLDQCCHAHALPIVLEPEVLRIAHQLASGAETETVDSPSVGGYELEEKKIAEVLATVALKRMAAILTWSTQLVESLPTRHTADVQGMRKYISRDLHHSNIAITRAITQLSHEGSAAWPEKPVANGTRPPLLRRHQQSAALSAEQVESLLHTLATAHVDRSTHLPRDVFVAKVLERSRREGFPEVWQDSTNVARLAIAWCNERTTDIAWSSVVFALICAQTLGFPTTEDLESITDQLRALCSLSHGIADLDDPRVSRTDFLAQTTLWFEDGSLPPQEAATWKTLVFTLFATDSSCDVANVFPMLFTFCIAPATARHVRAELASTFLPRYSRGLCRTQAVLSRWLSPSSSSSFGATPRVSSTQIRPLLSFAHVPVDETRLVETTGSLTWRRQDAPAFLAWCEAYDPRIAHRFAVYDTFAALTTD